MKNIGKILIAPGRQLARSSIKNTQWTRQHRAISILTKGYGCVASQCRGLEYKSSRLFSSYPSHIVVPMPALSPTMESGSIAKWLLKEGDRFEAGTAICEVETDKATVTYEATEEGFIAKILVGTGEVKVGQPLMITVEDADTVKAFSAYSSRNSAAAAVAAAPAAASPAISTPVAAPSAPSAHSTTISSVTPAVGGRVIASPFAKKVARDSGADLAGIVGSGPNGRILAADVLASPVKSSAASSSATGAATESSTARGVSVSVPASIPGVYQDFELSDLALAVAARHTTAKQVVPHYYLSVEVNLTKLLKLRADFNKSTDSEKEEGLSVIDFLVKASALAMKQVPDVNASWKDTFVRRYQQVDINLVVGTGSGLLTPVIRDAGGKGLNAISKEIIAIEESLLGAPDSSASVSLLQPGTFTIHNLGAYGIKAGAPIVLPPQACALCLGAIFDTVVPNPSAKEGEDNWMVSPVLTATLSCDHRVVDGAVGAQWLAAFKELVESPTTMLL